MVAAFFFCNSVDYAVVLGLETSFEHKRGLDGSLEC